ncbi:MAG: TIGR03768 family metallophosphoesterase [bacterium]
MQKRIANSKKKNIIWFYTFIAMGFIFIFINACNEGVPDQIDDLIDSDALTTVDRTIIPVAVPATSPEIFPYEVAKYSEYGYGVWQYGAGLPYEKRTDLMPANYNAASAVNTARLLNFFAITDIHIMDEETPAQAIYFGYKGNNPSAYSSTMLYTTQVLDVAIRTVNALNRKKQFDFGISLGDNSNSNQYNELRWFIDVLDGKIINPDSGADDDPVPGANNDYQDEFKAEGLDGSIPWYQVLGNHDHLFVGTMPANNYIQQTYISEEIINMGDPFELGGSGFYMGAINGRTIYGDIFGAGPVGDFSSPPKVPAADYSRHYISKEEWKSELFNSSTNPAGHGFSQQSNVFGCYTFMPKANLPIKVIVLDDTPRDDELYVLEHGYIDDERLNWLVSELDKGQTEGQLMIIAAHIPLSLIGYTGHSPVSATDLITKLHNYPNLMLWIAGHVHRNKVTVFKSPDDTKPELGFWQVETSSLRDYPQQFRTLEIVRNSDNTISIFATNVDPAMKEGSLAAKSRSYDIAIFQIMKLPMDNASYNAELVKPLSAEMQIKIQNYGTAIR